MKKQGFTLIELMVVVVIIGILAAVAVPKLFGMIAKSKASEVGPAAGTYVKLQDAYISETSDSIGNWKAIGYQMNNSSVFTYSGAENTVLLTAGMENAWVATSNVALNDCAKGKKWTLNVIANATTGGSAVYTAVIEDESNCRQLTPSFEKLTTKTSD